MKHLAKKLLLVAAVLMAFFALPASTAYAQNIDDVCNGVADAGASCDEGGGPTVGGVVRQFVFLFSSVVGVVAVVMVLMAGFKYITAGGDSSKTASAQSTLTYALVGLIVVALAQVIVRFVLFRATTAP